MLKKADDPWHALSPDPAHVLGRRVEADHPSSVYWALSADNAPGLVFRTIDARSVPKSFPKPKGIVIRVEEDQGESARLSLFLQNANDRDVFQTLCQDIIDFSSVGDVGVATARVFRRLAHWQSLLSRGRPGELAPHEVRGLMGELWILQQVMQGAGVLAALRSWVAPQDHPQDFALPSSIVEVKTRLAGSRPHVSISSLEQLEAGHLPLFLVVVELSPSEEATAVSLDDMATELLLAAVEAGAEAEDIAELALSCRGYSKFPSYDAKYKVAGIRAFEVKEEFPRIVRSGIDQRIQQATYVLDLSSLVPFECEPHQAIHPTNRD